MSSYVSLHKITQVASHNFKGPGKLNLGMASGKKKLDVFDDEHQWLPQMVNRQREANGCEHQFSTGHSAGYSINQDLFLCKTEEKKNSDYLQRNNIETDVLKEKNEWHDCSKK